MERDLVQIVIVCKDGKYSTIGMSEKVTEDRMDNLDVSIAIHIASEWARYRLREPNAQI